MGNEGPFSFHKKVLGRIEKQEEVP